MQVNFSPEGSNQRKEEEDAVYALELFLLDCFGNITIYKIVSVINLYCRRWLILVVHIWPLDGKILLKLCNIMKLNNKNVSPRVVFSTFVNFRER